MTIHSSHYSLLGVGKSADSGTLRRAFRIRSKALHPDTTDLPADEAAQKFFLLCEAYETLSNPQLRAAYDLTLSKLDELDTDKNFQVESMSGQTSIKNSKNGMRRPLSGGELFSLLMLFMALIICILLALLVAIAKGQDLQVLPSWLAVVQNLVNL